MHHIKKHIAVFLLFISALFVIPKELIHELSFHDDSVDHPCVLNYRELISITHHHCDILQVFVPPYNAFDETVLFLEITEIVSHYFFNATFASFEIVDPFSIRGPPAVDFSG